MGRGDALDIDDEELARLKRRKLSNFNEEESKSAVKSIQDSKNMIEEEEETKVNEEEQIVGPSIVALMSALPNASYFGLPSESVFNSDKLVTLFSNLSNIPCSFSLYL